MRAQTVRAFIFISRTADVRGACPHHDTKATSENVIPCFNSFAAHLVHFLRSLAAYHAVALGEILKDRASRDCRSVQKKKGAFIALLFWS